jgi:hypothetical protein
MAYLTQEERNKFRDELKQMSFRQANGRLKQMVSKGGRLAFYRNAESTGKWITRYVLSSQGTQVDLVEKNVFRDKIDKAQRVSNGYQLIDVVVEPTPDNRL